jgi:hypothetical protein
MTILLGLYLDLHHLDLHHLEPELLLAKEMMEQVGMLGKKLLLSMLLTRMLLVFLELVCIPPLLPLLDQLQLVLLLDQVQPMPSFTSTSAGDASASINERKL